MADETRLAELTDVFLSELKTLVGLRHTYSRFGGGGLTRSDIQQIWADAHKERDRLHANFPLTDDRSRDAEAWTALEQNHFRRVEQDINARVVLPFCVRLDKTIDTVIGMCPNNFIEHCIRDYTPGADAEIPPSDLSARARHIATGGLNGTTPTHWARDITRLPDWIGRMIRLLDRQPEVFKPDEIPQAAEFRQLLITMQTTAVRLLETRNHIRHELGMEPVAFENPAPADPPAWLGTPQGAGHLPPSSAATCALA